MKLQPPVPLSSLAGGTERFLAGFHTTQVYATLVQSRLQETLDAIGPPGHWQCDPQAATLTLRGHTFAAEMIGTFGKVEWMWAWANPFLNLPEAVTQVSRHVRDAARELEAPALLAGFVDLQGAAGPHHVAMQVVGHGFASAYYICVFPDSQAVYAIVDTIAPQWPKLYELQRAVNDLMLSGLHGTVPAITHAAEMLNCKVDRTSDRLTVVDGGDRLVAMLDGEGITRMESSVKL